MINLILFGPPGSGKGTQAAKLVEKFGLLHISTGDLFRYEIGNNTPLGIEAKNYMDKGLLVPDTVTIGMLNNKVEANPDVPGYIFDGFPRTEAQADALDALITAKNQSISKLLMLEVSDDEITSRILWLDGMEEGVNKGGIHDSYERYIYIHGTSDERRIGQPVSIGCVRMKNVDVIELFDEVLISDLVIIR